MAKKWSEVRRKHAPEIEERIRKEVKEAANVMTLEKHLAGLTSKELSRQQPAFPSTEEQGD